MQACYCSPVDLIVSWVIQLMLRIIHCVKLNCNSMIVQYTAIKLIAIQHNWLICSRKPVEKSLIYALQNNELVVTPISKLIQWSDLHCKCTWSVFFLSHTHFCIAPLGHAGICLVHPGLRWSVQTENIVYIKFFFFIYLPSVAYNWMNHYIIFEIIKQSYYVVYNL